MLEKLQEREQRSHPKNVPKVGSEKYARWTWNRPDLLNFPKAPCQWLCGREGLTRFHFTCLTCWLRRMTFNKYHSKNLRKYKTVMMILYPPKGKWFALPDNYLSYGIMIPTNEKGLVNPLKAGIVKTLMTIAERIAEL